MVNWITTLVSKLRDNVFKKKYQILYLKLSPNNELFYYLDLFYNLNRNGGKVGFLAIGTKVFVERSRIKCSAGREEGRGELNLKYFG